MLNCSIITDGESGIQAKDVSCGGSIFQRESELPHSPETGMGSNNCLAESACHSPFKNGAPYHFGARNMQKIPKFSHKNNQIDGDGYGSTRVAPYGSAALDDFQGESKPIPEEGITIYKVFSPFTFEMFLFCTFEKLLLIYCHEVCFMESRLLVLSLVVSLMLISFPLDIEILICSFVI